MQGNNSILRNLVLYEIYVRNHGPNGTFSDVLKDLDRIKSMGVDIILMPIHPLVRTIKRQPGCPYSIQKLQGNKPGIWHFAGFSKI